MRRFLIKLLNWEYWPQWVVYMPLGVYYCYLAIKARSFLFFSAANPGIVTGGMFFESKWDVLQLLPRDLFPETIFAHAEDDVATITEKMMAAGIEFPAIAKPDRGGRGWGVQKIENEAELAEYRAKMKVDFLVQAYAGQPLELSVFYVRHPDMERGKISSITFKKLLTVTGDGRSTLRELILQNDRAYLQKDVLFPQLKDQLDEVPAEKQEWLLVPYGNHVRGAEFRDWSHMADAQTEAAFDNICKQIPGFFYGRFDLRVSSLDALKAGEDIAILELNGTGAEPAHIYDPAYSFVQATKDLCWHYRQMFEIAQHNRKAGERYMAMNEYRSLKRMEKAYKKQAA